MDWHDILERAAWTAVQTFAGSFGVTELAVAIGAVDITAIQGLALTAAGATVAAVLSFVKTVSQERLAVLDTRK